MTFSPESAAKVSGRTNSWAARVMTTCTRTPRSCSRRTTSADLYAAIPPETPRAIFMAREGERRLSKTAAPIQLDAAADTPDSRPAVLRPKHQRRSERPPSHSLRIGQECLVQSFGGSVHGRLRNFRNQPFHLA